MKVGDFVYIKPWNIFGFIERIPNQSKYNKAYKIKEPSRKDPWYFYDKHLVLIYES